MVLLAIVPFPNAVRAEGISESLERGRADGSFARSVDPMELYISIASLCYFSLSNAYTLSAIFKRNLMTPERCDARVAHMVEMVLGYLRAEK